jgi:methyl-accepting chemotaxis protein
LANESSENADRIKDLVRNVQGQIATVATDIELASSKARNEVERAKVSTGNLDRIAKDADAVVSDMRGITNGAAEACAWLEEAGKASRQIAAAAEETARATTEAASASEQGSKAALEIAQAIEEIASQADELQNG